MENIAFHRYRAQTWEGLKEIMKIEREREREVDRDIRVERHRERKEEERET